MKKIIPAFLILLLLLSACGSSGQAPENASQPGSAPMEAAEAAEDSPGATGTEAPVAWETFQFASEAPGPDGCYIMQVRPDSGVNILYADYASGQLVYLCNRPECIHDNESCTSFRSEGNSGSLCSYGERVYILDMNASEDHVPWLSVCDKNGENSKRLTQLESGSMMVELFAADGDAFYTLQTLYSGDEDPYGTRRLVRIGLADGTKTNVGDKDYSFASMLSGVGNEVVLYTYTFPENGDNISDQTIIGVNRSTGAEREIYNVPTGYIVGAEGSFAYVLRMEDGAIDAVDLHSGEVQTTHFDKTAIKLYHFVPDVSDLAPEDAEYMLANPPTMYYSRGVFDGKLFLDCSEEFVDNNYQQAQYAIDLSTGEITRTTLSIGFEMRQGSSIIIYDEVGNDFLVLHDYINTPYPSINKDGTPYEAPNITNQYALISKDDFYASRPNYRDFVLS